MPFKGDMRLGGPHDNEANLNGSSDMDGALPAGALIRTDTNVLRPIADGGNYVSYYAGADYQIANQTWTVPVRSDGLGGEYYDWSTASNPTYLSGGVLPDTSVTDVPTYISAYSTQYQNGTYSSYYSHDGSGGYSVIQNYSYYPADPNPFHLESGVPHYQEFESNSYQVGTKSVAFYHDGLGNSTSSTYGSPEWYSDGTVVGSKNVTTNVYVNELSQSYQSGGWIYDIEVYQQNLSLRSYPAHGTFITAGTRITDGQPYYHDGNGGYYYSNIGIPTGNSSSQTEYINISTTSGTSDYPNGSSNSIEYYDGQGGTYWQTSRSYAEYGALFTSSSYYDGMNYYNYNYYSDGVGGYYVESY